MEMEEEMFRPMFRPSVALSMSDLSALAMKSHPSTDHQHISDWRSVSQADSRWTFGTGRTSSRMGSGARQIHLTSRMIAYTKQVA